MIKFPRFFRDLITGRQKEVYAQLISLDTGEI